MLENFYKKTQPGGPGWKSIVENAKNKNIEIVEDTEGWSVPSGILAMLLGLVLIYSCMFFYRLLDLWRNNNGNFNNYFCNYFWLFIN